MEWGFITVINYPPSLENIIYKQLIILEINSDSENMILQDSVFLLVPLRSPTSWKLKPNETIKKKESSIFMLN